MRERFRFTVDAEMITPPTIVLNHRTKLREIVVQDANFNFYLIGNNGSLLWKETRWQDYQPYQASRFIQEWLSANGIHHREIRVDIRPQWQCRSTLPTEL